MKIFNKYRKNTFFVLEFLYEMYYNVFVYRAVFCHTGTMI